MVMKNTNYYLGTRSFKEQARYFDSFPGKDEETVSPETVTAIVYLTYEISQSKTTPLLCITEHEVSMKGEEFILKAMKLDWRERPRAQEILNDRWFQE